MTAWWISCDKWTIRVLTEDERIVEAAPIAKKFIGQPIQNLIHWGARFKGLQLSWEELD